MTRRGLTRFLACALLVFASGQAQAQLSPGEGFLVGESELGSMSISAYVLVRYLNQVPPEQDFTDHLGRERNVDTRQDIQVHRMMVWFKGFLFDPKFTYAINLWTVNATNAVANIASLNYAFSERFNLGGGVGALPGIRSLNYEHPYFLSTDRSMSEDFFRPGFTAGVWVNGEALEGLNYRFMVGNNLSQIEINAAELTRNMALGGTIWWLPTTGEFGPREGYGDYEHHEKLATRIGVSATTSREDRFSQTNIVSPDNTQIKLSDSLNLFETGALADGVTVQQADYSLVSFDAAFKYRGLFFFSEYYLRWLDDFDADGPLPIDSIFDHGFNLQVAYQLLPRKLEPYLWGSYIYGEFNDSWEAGGGFNFYFTDTRNWRLNTLLTYVHQSAASSLFGHYTGGMTGVTGEISMDVFF